MPQTILDPTWLAHPSRFCERLDMRRLLVLLISVAFAAGCCKTKGSLGSSKAVASSVGPAKAKVWAHNIARVARTPLAIDPSTIDKNGERSVIYSYDISKMGMRDGMPSLAILRSDKDAWSFRIGSSKYVELSDFGETEFVTMGLGSNRWFKIRSGPLAGHYVEKISLFGDDERATWLVVNSAFACTSLNPQERRLECCGY